MKPKYYWFFYRPQPGLAGLTKPTPNRNPDPNINATKQ